MGQRQQLRSIIFGTACATLGFAASFPLVVWQSDKAPEFYGAFYAAIIAAAALLFGTYFQDNLAKRRDEDQRTKDRIANALGLRFWLSHSVHELEFIAGVLERMKSRMTSQGTSNISMPLDQFREGVTSQFFDELLPRAKQAALLPPNIAGQITRDIYETFTATDRIFRLRGASSDFRPSADDIEQYLFLLNVRTAKFRRAADLVEEYLVGVGAMTPPSVEIKLQP